MTCSHPVCGQETEGGIKKTTEAPSPDGKFAFRYTEESDSENQTYDLIDNRSGKVLLSVAESDPDFGPSARFHADEKLTTSLGLESSLGRMEVRRENLRQN